MNRYHILSFFAFLLSLQTLTIQTAAARSGKANLIIKHQNPSPDGTPPQAGDILNLAFVIDAQNENITGAVIYLTLDEEYFEIIPARELPFIVFPFHKGDWLQGTTALNSTLGDSLTNSMSNNRAGFQLVYNEDRAPSGFGGGTREGVSGRGVLAELQVRLKKTHTNPLQAITYEALSPTGSESGYFHKDHPGVVYSLNVSTTTGVLGDFNGDNHCDFNDFIKFVQNYATQRGQSGYLSRYDLDGDLEIGFGDFLLFTEAYGK